MSDLIERLRDPLNCPWNITYEAADRIEALERREKMLVEALRCIETNLSKGMSKSIQKLQSREIHIALAAVKEEQK